MIHKEKLKYVHHTYDHNLTAPMEMVPHIVRLFHPKSVVDVGCGLGTFLYCFKNEGITDVLGVDGDWVDRALLAQYLTKDEFLPVDLEQPLLLGRKYDLVVCLEVAEHLSPEKADQFVASLVSLGNLILFSAAVPTQGGQNHLNEQWPAYWEEKFARFGFRLHDIIRPIFWDNPRIPTWYKQNSVLYMPESCRLQENLPVNPLRNVVHYESYARRGKRLKEITGGEWPLGMYFLFLFRALLRIIRFKKPSG